MNKLINVICCKIGVNSNSRYSSLSAAFHVFISFTLLGIFALYVKAEQMGRSWWSVARFIGRTDEKELSFYEKLSFFSSDLVINFVVLPLLASLITILLPRRVRLPVGAFLAFIWAVILFVSLRAYIEIGQYLTKDMFFDAVQWALTHPESLEDYISFTSLVKFGLLLGSLAAIFFISSVGRTAKALIAQQVRKISNYCMVFFPAYQSNL